ncbi:hypothetical protein GQ457_02G027580 [Hibiscus cannabinus]
MDSEMNRVCCCGVRSKLTTSWTHENPGRRFWGCENYQNGVRGCNFFFWYNPAVTERSKGVIVGLLKKIVAMEQERKNEIIVGILLLGDVILVGFILGKNYFLAFDLGFRWVKVVVVNRGFGFMLLKVVVNGGFGV